MGHVGHVGLGHVGHVERVLVLLVVGSVVVGGLVGVDIGGYRCSHTSLEGNKFIVLAGHVGRKLDACSSCEMSLLVLLSHIATLLSWIAFC